MKRKYREVKRKAHVGERIRIVNAQLHFGHYRNGDVKKVVEVGADGDAWFDSNTSVSGRFFATRREYVVLVPVSDFANREVTTYKLIGIPIWRKTIVHYEAEVAE
ncbi:hypothetical protein [Paenibacillus sp. NPDC057967]|uniref:hypothetical protein n=1 Tax=Paenibacillus sp. NPDC057967 TaxID=3346293 RepID=UPI0036DBBD58